MSFTNGRVLRRVAALGLALAGVCRADSPGLERLHAQNQPAAAAPAAHVRSTPENVVLGWFPIDRSPVLRISSGAIVRIDTLSNRGATQEQDPVSYFGQYGVKPEEVLQDVKDFWVTRADRPREGRGPHVITGPIYIEGAGTGDTLAVEILEIATRVPYGINSTSASRGVIAKTYATRQDDPVLAIPEDSLHFIRTGTQNGRPVAFFSDTIHVPLHPFMGIMAVAPENPTVGQPGVTIAGVQGSAPPGPYGGNLDFKDLTTGTTLYLPVFHPGALFYTGDPHGAQGDGEVSGGAIEQSNTGVFRFTVLKGKRISSPRAENATHYFAMGIDLDLDRAMRLATYETVDFLVKEKGLTADKALSLSSIAVDFRIAEAVDGTQVVVGAIPKNLFIGD